MGLPTLLRIAEHRALKNVPLSGTVLDLGGDARSEYRTLYPDATFTTVNIDEAAKPDIVHDLEKPLTVPDASYDHALLINVLEHVFEYRQLLCEAARVTKPGGSVVIVVPFLFPVHPSPHDYWRFSGEALRKECANAGLSVATLTPLGAGVFSARFLLLDRLLPVPLRLVLLLVRPLVVLADALWTGIARLLGRKYSPADYALGYCVQATKDR